MGIFGILGGSLFALLASFSNEAFASDFQVALPSHWQRAVQPSFDGAIYVNKKSKIFQAIVVQKIELRGTTNTIFKTSKTTLGSTVAFVRETALESIGINGYTVIEDRHELIASRDGKRSLFITQSRHNGFDGAEVQVLERQYLGDRFVYQVLYLEETPALNDRKRVETLLKAVQPTIRPNRYPASEVGGGGERGGPQIYDQDGRPFQGFNCPQHPPPPDENVVFQGGRILGECMRRFVVGLVQSIVSLTQLSQPFGGRRPPPGSPSIVVNPEGNPRAFLVAATYAHRLNVLTIADLRRLSRERPEDVKPLDEAAFRVHLQANTGLAFGDLQRISEKVEDREALARRTANNLVNAIGPNLEEIMCTTRREALIKLCEAVVEIGTSFIPPAVFVKLARRVALTAQEARRLAEAVKAARLRRQGGGRHNPRPGNPAPGPASPAPPGQPGGAPPGAHPPLSNNLPPQIRNASPEIQTRVRALSGSRLHRDFDIDEILRKAYLYGRGDDAMRILQNAGSESVEATHRKLIDLIDQAAQTRARPSAPRFDGASNTETLRLALSREAGNEAARFNLAIRNGGPEIEALFLRIAKAGKYDELVYILRDPRSESLEILRGRLLRIDVGPPRSGGAGAPSQANFTEAEFILGRRLTDAERDAIQRAHAVGHAQPGRNGRPAGYGNYTDAQLREKAEILRRAGFNESQRRALIEGGVVGNGNGTHNTPFISYVENPRLPNQSQERFTAQIIGQTDDGRYRVRINRGGRSSEEVLTAEQMQTIRDSANSRLYHQRTRVQEIDDFRDAWARDALTGEKRFISFRDQSGRAQGAEVLHSDQYGSTRVRWYNRETGRIEEKTLTTDELLTARLSDRDRDVLTGHRPPQANTPDAPPPQQPPPPQQAPPPTAEPRPQGQGGGQNGPPEVAPPRHQPPGQNTTAPLTRPQHEAIDRYHQNLEEFSPRHHYYDRADLDPSTGRYYWRQWHLTDVRSIPNEGWKLHVTAKPETAERIGRAILPFLQRNGIGHKVVEDLGRFAAMGPRDTQFGKYITIYPRNPEEARRYATMIRDELRRLGFGPNDFARHPYEAHHGPGVTYRYGLNSGHQMYNPTTRRWEPDDRRRLRPDWVPDLFP